MNSTVPAPHIIASYSSYPPLFSQASNPYVEEAKGNVSGEGEGMEEARKVFILENEGNTADLSGDRIMESVESPE